MLKKIKILKNQIGDKINIRLKEFSSFSKKNNEEWFSELCFCILTANSKAKTAINIQNELKCKGFLTLNHNQLSNCIKKNKHRFHNNKAKYIIEARKFSNIKDILKKLKTSQEKRDFIVKNIKGLGYKEASHFLRNIGYFDLAILDRHVLGLLIDYDYLIEKPKSLNKKKYEEIELILEKISKKLKMSQAELDMYLWYMKTNEVLK
jgi:N-glycosylase/DNA lyase